METADPAIAAQASAEPVPPSWLVGMGILPFGLVAGFVVTALPFLLSRAGVPLDRIATVSAVAMSPTFWAFLVTPIVDVGFTRRRYAFALALLAAVSLAAALWLFSPDRLALFTALVLVAELAIVLQASAVNGWYSEFVPDAMRGRVGGWVNAANLGGGALGAMLVMGLAARLSPQVLGLLIASAVLLSTLFMRRFPAPLQPKYRLGEIFHGTLRSVRASCRETAVRLGFLLFLAPVSCVAAINLFAGLGQDFRAPTHLVVWATGLGAAGTSAVGAVLGGWVADRSDRGALYLGAGSLAGIIALGMALAPHTPVAFLLGVLLYNGVAGVCYAAFTALALQLVGTGHPAASTQFGLFAAATNGAICYMTLADGRGYQFFGVRGLFLVDGLACLMAAFPLLLFWRWRLRKDRQAGALPVALAEEA